MACNATGGDLPLLSIMNSPLLPNFSFDDNSAFSAESLLDSLSPTGYQHPSRSILKDYTSPETPEHSLEKEQQSVLSEDATNIPSDTSIASDLMVSRKHTYIEADVVSTADSEASLLEPNDSINNINSNSNANHNENDDDDKDSNTTHVEHTFESSSTKISAEADCPSLPTTLVKKIDKDISNSKQESCLAERDTDVKFTESVSARESIPIPIPIPCVTSRSRLSCNMSIRSQQQPVPQHSNRYRASFIAPTLSRPDSMLRTHPTEQELRQFVQTLMSEMDGHQLTALGIDRILALVGWEFVLSCCRMVDHVGRDFCRRAIMGAVGNAMLAKKPASTVSNRYSMIMDAPTNGGLTVPTHFMRINSTAGFTERDIHLNEVSINFTIGAYPSTQSSEATQRLMDALVILERRLITEQVVDYPSWTSITAEQISVITHYVSDDGFHQVFGQESRITFRDAQIFGVTTQEAVNYTGALHFFGNFRLPLEGLIGRDAFNAEDYIRVLIIDPAFSLGFTCAESDAGTDLPAALLNLWRHEAWCPSGVTLFHDRQDSVKQSSDYAEIADGPNHWYRPVICVERRVTGELLTFIVGCSRGSSSREDVVIKLYTSAYLALKQQELWLGKRAYKKAEQTPYVYAYLIDRTSIELFYMTGSRQGRSETIDYTFDHIHTISIASSGSRTRLATPGSGASDEDGMYEHNSPFSMKAVLQACTIFTSMAAYVYERLYTMENGTRGRIYDNFRAEVDKCALLPALEMKRVLQANELESARKVAKQRKASHATHDNSQSKETDSMTDKIEDPSDKTVASRQAQDKLKEKRQKYVSSVPSFNTPILEAMQKREILNDTVSRLSSAKSNRRSFASSRRSVILSALPKYDENGDINEEYEASLASDNERRQRALAGMDRIMFSDEKSDGEVSQDRNDTLKKQPTSPVKEATKDVPKAMEQQPLNSSNDTVTESAIEQTGHKIAENAESTSSVASVKSDDSVKPSGNTLMPVSDTKDRLKQTRRSAVYGKETLISRHSKHSSSFDEFKQQTSEETWRALPQKESSTASTTPVKTTDIPVVPNQQLNESSMAAHATPTRPLPMLKNILEARQNGQPQTPTKPLLRDQILLANARRVNTQTNTLSDQASDDSAPLATYAIHNKSATANQALAVQEKTHSAVEHNNSNANSMRNMRPNSFQPTSLAHTSPSNTASRMKARASVSPLAGFVFPAPPPPLTNAQRKSIIEGVDPRIVLGKSTEKPTVTPQVPVARSNPVSQPPALVKTTKPKHQMQTLGSRRNSKVIDPIDLPELPCRIPHVKTPQDPLPMPVMTTTRQPNGNAPLVSSTSETAIMTSAVQRGPPSSRQKKYGHKKRSPSNSSLSSFFSGSNKSDINVGSTNGSANAVPVKKTGSFRNLRSLFR